MKKSVKKILSLLIALAICAGHIAVPAAAVEIDEPITAPTVEATITGTITDTTHDPATGEIITTTTTITQWDSLNDNGATVTGSQTEIQYESQDDIDGTPLYQGGSTKGQETESKTTVSTESATDEEVLISESTQQTGSGSETPTSTETENSDWDTISNKEGQWEEGDVTEGQFTADEKLNQSSGSSQDIVIDEPENITIHMTPGKTATVTKEISVEEIVSQNLQIPAEGTSTKNILDDNGNIIGQETTTVTAKTDKDGNVIGYEITTNTSIDQVNTQVGQTQNTTTTKVVPSTPKLPQGVEAGTKAIYNDNNEIIGSEETVIEEVKDAGGNVIGYKIIKTKTTNRTNVTTGESNADTTTENAEPVVTIQLPEKPAASENVAEDGTKTVVTVQDMLDENGNVIGYEVITTKTDKDGNVITTATEKRHGTKVTVNTATVTDPTSVRTTTEEQIVEVEITEISAMDTIKTTTSVTEKLNQFVNTSMTEKEFQFVEIDGKVYFVYTGNMSVSEGNGHGDISGITPITPDSNLFNKNSSKDLTTGGTAYGKDGYYHWGQDPTGDDFQLIGNGISSNLMVKTNDSYTTASQFRLENAEGEIYYALCIDLDTTAQAGFYYDMVDISSQDYFQNATGTTREAAEKIRSIVLNGFWGTTSGAGSMEDVKDLLRDYLEDQNMSETKIKSILDSLTEGQALTATQAALWKYGSKNSDTVVNEKDLVTGYADTQYWTGWGYKYTEVDHKSADYTNTEYLYKALLAAAQNPVTESNEGVEFLDAEDITGGAITLKEKVSEDTSGKGTYNTDISFSLGIEPSKLNGDLIVTVMVDGKEVEQVRLAGKDDPLLKLGRITKNDDGSYTIPNVELQEGVYVTLNLSGTQAVGTGVYVYQSEKIGKLTSQTLVGLATGDRQVNLNMNMVFTANESDASVQKTSGSSVSGGTTTDTRVDTKTDVKVEKMVTTTTSSSASMTSSGTVKTEVFADVTITHETTIEDKTERFWLTNWFEDLSPDVAPEDDDHEVPEGEDDEPTPDPTEGDLVEIEEEEVPLAAAPQTGDISQLFAAISTLSLGGLFLLNRKGKDEE